MEVMISTMAAKYTPRYFTEQEFTRVGCRMDQMDPELLRKLDAARKVAGVPFVITCALRSREDDIRKGRSGNSAHVRGRAVDVACTGSKQRYIILAAALQVGFKRIGIGKRFIHLDIDTEELVSPCVWLYTS